MTERGVQLPRFREQVSDILLKTYFLLERYYGNEGADIVLQMILRALQAGADDAWSAEVSFFGARSILDALPEETPFDAKSLHFLKQLVEFIVTNQQAS